MTGSDAVRQRLDSDPDFRARCHRRRETLRHNRHPEPKRGVYPDAAKWAWQWVALVGFLAALAILAALAGCSPVAASYVHADRATFEAVAPEYVAYVSSDSALSSEQKERRQETVRSWEARLEQAEGDE